MVMRSMHDSLPSPASFFGSSAMQMTRWLSRVTATPRGGNFVSANIFSLLPAPCASCCVMLWSSAWSQKRTCKEQTHFQVVPIKIAHSSFFPPFFGVGGGGLLFLYPLLPPPPISLVPFNTELKNWYWWERPFFCSMQSQLVATVTTLFISAFYPCTICFNGYEYCIVHVLWNKVQIKCVFD